MWSLKAIEFDINIQLTTLHTLSRRVCTSFKSLLSFFLTAVSLWGKGGEAVIWAGVTMT